MNEPKTFRKKPVQIQAMRFEPWTDLLGDTILDFERKARKVAEWCGGRFFYGPSTTWTFWIEIPTLEGVMKASPGDWIIKGVQGEFYPCRNDIFEATYEEVKTP